MIIDELFDSALLYKKTKLWKKLSDTMLFGVRHFDGEVGYCCVMGMMGELTALAVYPGQAGLDSLRILHDDVSPTDFLGNMERMRCQDCLMLSMENKSCLLPRDVVDVEAWCKRKGVALRGRNAYPHFERFRPGVERWYLEDGDDQHRMREALLAALEVARALTESMRRPEALGFDEGAPYDREIPLLVPEGDGWRWERHALPPRAKPEYPAAPAVDDITAARLAKGKRAGQWAAKVFRFFEPISPEVGEEPVSIEALSSPPFFPMALALMDLDGGRIIDIKLAEHLEDWPEALGGAFVDVAQRQGLPRQLLVEDDRTAALLKPLCGRLGVRLEQREAIELLDEMLQDFAEKNDIAREDLGDEIEGLFDMMRDPQGLGLVPDELIESMLPVIGKGVLPGDIEAILRKEAACRGLH